MNNSRTCTRPRILLALLLAALVLGAVPVRPRASRGDKPSGAAAWRPASARPMAPRPDAGFNGAPPLPASAPEPRAAPLLVRATRARLPARTPPADPPARARLPRAPPAA